jgi:succinate dehydrogenase/fumarate reductase cytochrome b subunit
VSFGWLAVWSAGIATLGFDVRLFNRLCELQGNIGVRAVLCLVTLSVLFHSLDGLRRLVADYLPFGSRVEAPARLATVFLTAALGVPACLVILWPILGGQR